MKTFTKILIVLFFTNCFLQVAKAQNTVITDDNSYVPAASAMLDVKSTTKGLLIPRLTTAERAVLSLSSPATGLMVYDSDLNQFMYFNGTTWTTLLTPESDTLLNINAQNIYLANPLWNMGIGSTTPGAKLEVKSDLTDGIDDPIFAVVNNTGDTVFAVYPQGVQINVYDDISVKAKSKKGGFAVGGFSPAKGTTKEFLRITSDSIRMYVKEDTSTVGKAASRKGGFAVGGFAPAKGSAPEFLRVTPDSIRMYIAESPTAKAASRKGGFAVGGFSPAKGTGSYTLFTVNEDSAQVFIGDSTAGFGVANLQGNKGSLLNLTTENYFIGHESGMLSKIGKHNTFFGYQAGKSNVSGFENAFIGYKSGFNNDSGSRNIFLGKGVGYNNISGNENIFIGNASGTKNNANQNIFIGVESGKSNTTGYQNIFLGYKSGFSNIGGTFEEGSVNTFIGMESGYSNTTGLANTFVGHKAGWSNIVGKFNTYLGRYAGENSSGDFNVFIGSEAGRFQAGSYKLCINATQNPGYEKPLIYGEFDNKRVVIAGDGADNFNNRTFFVKGVSGGTSVWNNDSDKRLKKDIVTIPDALDKVLSLRGVNFNWKDTVTYEKGLQMGFIAQEVEKIIPEVVTNTNDHYSMSYASLTAVLVEAIKEQQKIIQKLQIENSEMKAELLKIDETNKRVDELYRIMGIKASK